MGSVTAAFYVCMFKGVSLEWFQGYSLFVAAIVGFIVTGVSVTDAVGAWRSKEK